MPYKIQGEVEIARGLGLPHLNTAERLAYVPPREGYLVYDTDLSQVFVFRGGVNDEWEVSGDVSNPRVHAPLSELILSGTQPSDSEIETFALDNEHTDVVIFFTGDEDPESDILLAWLIDVDGRATAFVSEVPSDIFTQFNAWELNDGAEPVRAGLFGATPTVILGDANNGTARYTLSSQLPLTTEQTVCLRLKRDLNATTSMLLRTAGAGNQELIISLDTGEVSTSQETTGIAPTVDQVNVTDNIIEVLATFQPNAAITAWDLFPAVGPSGIVDNNGFDGLSQGTLELIKLDLNAALPSAVQGLEHTKIDSSAAAVTETLEASASNNTVRLFVNTDVTNTATLAVQAGETLNGVVDGTFLFSNYAVGTQFRADEVAGGWVVSVVGASTQTDLNSIQISTSVPINNADQDRYVFDETLFTIGSELTLDASGSITGLKANKTYKITTHLRTENGAGADGRSFFRVVDLTSGNNIGKEISIATTGSSTTYSTQSGQTAFFTPTVNSEIGIDFVSGDLGELTNQSTVTVEEIPTTESVLAGSLEAQDIEELVFNETVSDAGSWDFGPYADVAALQAAGFTSLRLQVAVEHGSANISVDNYSTEVDLTEVIPDSRPLIGEIGTNFLFLDVNPLDTTGGNINLEGNYATTAILKIYAVRPQQTVIMPEALATAPASEWSDGDTSVWSDTNQRLEPVTSITSIATEPLGRYAIRGWADSVDTTDGVNVAPLNSLADSDLFEGGVQAAYENNSQAWRSGGDTLTVPTGFGGDYRVSLQFNHPANERINVGAETQNTSGTFFSGLRINGGAPQWLALNDNNGLPDISIFVGEFPLTEGDIIELVYDADGANNEDIFFQLEFHELPETIQVASSDEVEVQDLNILYFTEGTNDDDFLSGDIVDVGNLLSISGLIAFDNATDVWTLPQSDIPYILNADIGVAVDGTPANLTIRWTDTSSNNVGGLNVEATFSPGASNTLDIASPTAFAVVDASAGPVDVRLEATAGPTTAGTTNTWDIISVIGSIRQESQRSVSGGVDTLDTTGFTSVREAVLGNYARGTPTNGTSAPNGQQRSVPLANVVESGDITYDDVNNGFIIPTDAVVEINGITQSQSASQNDIRIINSTTSVSNVPGLSEVSISPISIYQGIYTNDTGSDVLVGIGVSGGGNTGNSNTVGYLMIRKIN